MAACIPNSKNGDIHYEPDYSEPLKVIIVGGGITGLATAVSLRQAGHLVTVFEASDFTNESGPTIRLGPNSSGILKRFGFKAGIGKAVNITHVTEFTLEGEQKNEKDASKLGDLYQHPWEYYDRAELHHALLELATSHNGNGSPVNVNVKSPVDRADPGTGKIYLLGGKEVTGDVVIVADGVYSQIRKSLFNIEAKAIQPGKVAVNFTISVTDILDNPIVQRFENRSGRFETWMSNGRQLDIYQVTKGLLICNGTYACKQTHSDSFANGATLRDDVLETFTDFAPQLLQILQRIDPNGIRSWPQNDIPTVETWFQKKLTLSGDAAHPFLPYEAQGSAHSLEDAAAIGAVLPFGTTPEEVEGRLGVFQKSRQGRINHIQNFTRDIAKDTSSSKIERFQKFGSYTYGHDAHDYATGQLRQFITEQSKGARRMPTTFGIFPDPYQSLSGKPFKQNETSYRSASISFETSKTYLMNFLPTPAYSIASPGNIALATFFSYTFKNVPWLGGRGYNTLGLYIHNVQVEPSDASADAKPVTGRYLPVLFTDLVDPISNGREELGVAQVFATLDITSTEDRYKLVASWGGTAFAEMMLDGLQSEDERQPMKREPLRKSLSSTPDQGVLHYKYIPATGRSGTADISYATMASNPSVEGNTLRMVSQKKAVAPLAKARVEILKEEKKNLPTLWNIVEGLRGIEIFKVVSAELVDGLGSDDAYPQVRI